MRRGLTTEYKREKLAKIESERLGDEHYDRTATRYYGDFDPVEGALDHINPRACGAPANCHHDVPDLNQVPGAQNTGTVNAWKQGKACFIACTRCSTKGRAAKTAWQSVLEWNKSPCSTHPSYRTLPLFGLRPLEPAAAKERLIGIRHDLELRSKEAGLRRDLGLTRTNRQYLERMKAYLAWCIYAQALVKEHTGRE